MSDPLPDLLHKTLKDLHSLHTHRDHLTYEPLLRHAIAKVIQVINYNDKSYSSLQLQSSSGDAPHSVSSLDILYYSPANKSIDSLANVNIVQFIQSFNSHEVHSNHSVLESLVDLLSKIKGKRPIRIKDSYSLIFSKLSTLIQFFIRFQTESENKLVEFVQRAAIDELHFYHDLEYQLDNLDDQDTQNIADFLDNVISSAIEDDQDEQDSIFSYERDPEIRMPQQRLQSNNADFDHLYSAFLKILGFKNERERDYKNYMRIMINLFKRHSGIEFMEIESFKYKEMKLNQIFNFFICDTDDFQILPEQFKEINNRVLAELEISPEMRREGRQQLVAAQPSLPGFENTAIPPNSIQDEAHNLNSFSTSAESLNSPETNHPYSKEDQVRLYNNLKHIIPLLNEFGLDFDTEFPQVFRYYLQIMYEDLPTLTDSSDLRFVDSIVHLVNLIVDYENEDLTEDVQIKHAVSRFHEIHSKLVPNQGFIGTLLMRLSSLEYATKKSMKRSTFQIWKGKHQEVQQLSNKYYSLWASKESSYLQKTYLKRWFGKRVLFNSLELEANMFYENVLLDKIFKSNWIQKLNDQVELGAIADNFFLKRFFISWSDETQKMKKLELKAKSLDQTSVEVSIFSLLNKKFERQLELSKTADALARSFESSRHEKLLVKLWCTWRERLPIEKGLGENKLVLLLAKERKWVESRAYTRWKQKFALEDMCATVKKRNDKHLLEYIFKRAWEKKFTLKHKMHFAMNKKHFELKSQYLYHWKERKDQIETAHAVHRQNLLRRSVKIWKVQVASSKFLDSSNKPSILLKQFFTKWHLNYRLRHLSTERDLQLKEVTLSRWIAKKEKTIELAQKSIDLDRYVTLDKRFTQWASVTKNVVEYEMTADLNLQRKFYNKILEKNHLFTYRFNQKADKFLALGVVENRIALAFAFEKWKSKYGDRFENKSISKIFDFQIEVRNPNLLSLSIQKWVIKYNQKQAKLDQLDQRYNKFVQNSKFRKVYWQKWQQKSLEKMQLNESAISFERSVLYKKFLLIWYDQFVNKGVYLSEIANNYIDDKQFQHIRTLLGVWSMKYMKLIQRNNQSCDMFIEKWKNAKLKSILELWLFKLNEGKDAGNKFDDANSSIFSNSSPLANRSLRSNPQNEAQDNSSYLYTPLKQQVHSRLVFTPKLSRLSPTKLQETNQRIKNERIDALRKHFGRAKGTSTPRRGATNSQSRNNTNYTVISPTRGIDNLDQSRFESLLPKPNSPSSKPLLRESTSHRRDKSKSYKNVIPPKPPNFEPLKTDYDYTVESFSSSTDFLSQSSQTVIEDEKTVIENAKKLRRITPIMFPTEEEGSQPRFSPVKKLKERLKNNLITVSPSPDDNY